MNFLKEKKRHRNMRKGRSSQSAYTWHINCKIFCVNVFLVPMSSEGKTLRAHRIAVMWSVLLLKEHHTTTLNCFITNSNVWNASAKKFESDQKKMNSIILKWENESGQMIGWNLITNLNKRRWFCEIIVRPVRSSVSVCLLRRSKVLNAA